MKKEKGITLVALVISIVVLLILASVLIGFLTGDNGLITRAIKAKQVQLKADVLEDINIKILEVSTDKQGEATVADLLIKLKDDTEHEYIVKTTSKYAKLSTKGSITDENIGEFSNIETCYITRDGVEVKVTKDLKAQLEDDYKVANNGNGHILSYSINVPSIDVPESILVAEGDTATVDFSNPPTRNGYTFLGWSTQNNATEAEYTVEGDKTLTMGSENVVLYAVWREETVEGVTTTLNAGETYTIPRGFHDGTGKVKANSLASQTSATATANDILSGKSAWVNGSLVNGSYTPQGSGTIGFRNYTIPERKNGSKTVFETGLKEVLAVRGVDVRGDSDYFYISSWIKHPGIPGVIRKSSSAALDISVSGEKITITHCRNYKTYNAYIDVVGIEY